MSSNQIAVVKFVLKLIKSIDVIKERHGGIIKALEDEHEGQHAMLMCLMQIGENLKKLDNNLVIKYNLENEVKGSSGVRNFIAHEYEKIDFGLAENVMRYYLPPLQEKLEKLLTDIS